jgi:hypothetical protein
MVGVTMSLQPVSESKDEPANFTPMRFAPGVYDLIDALNAVSAKHEHEQLALLALTVAALVGGDPVREHHMTMAMGAYGYRFGRPPPPQPERPRRRRAGAKP